MVTGIVQGVFDSLKISAFKHSFIKQGLFVFLRVHPLASSTGVRSSSPLSGVDGEPRMTGNSRNDRLTKIKCSSSIITSNECFDLLRIQILIVLFRTIQISLASRGLTRLRDGSTLSV